MEELERTTSLKISRQLQGALDDITSHYDQNQVYVKKRVYKHNSVSYINEIKVYKLLEGLNIAPKLIAHGIIYRRDWCGFYIVTERHGISLLDKYFDQYLHNSYDGPGMSSVCPVVNPDWFNHKFPDDLIPKGVVDQVKDICYKLHSVGIIHTDVHAGNFLINEEGIVKVIDFAHNIVIN